MGSRKLFFCPHFSPEKKLVSEILGFICREWLFLKFLDLFKVIFDLYHGKSLLTKPAFGRRFLELVPKMGPSKPKFDCLNYRDSTTWEL